MNLEQSQQTAQIGRSYGGWVTITHPFHPKNGQQYYVSNFHPPIEGFLFLRDTEGNMLRVPKEWTDQSIPSTPPTIIDPYALLELVKWVEAKKQIAS